MSAIPHYAFPAAAPARLERDAVEERPSACGGFALFLCVNAALFIRPAEIVEGLKDLPLYEVLIVLCLLCSLRAVGRVLRCCYLASNPQVLCILCLLPAVVMSNLVHGNLYLVRTGGTQFVKLLIYFVLLLALVDSPARLRKFLIAISILVVTTATICLLQFHDVIQLNLNVSCVDHVGTDPDTGEAIKLLRLQGSGLFSDPNDFALVLVAAILICTHLMLEPRRWLKRLIWLVPIAPLAYAFALTHSRGGFLTLLSGAAVMMMCRLSWRKSLICAAIVFPMLFVALAGRQTDINLGDADDTAQSRIQLWRDSLVLFKSSPIFGIGFDRLAEVNGMVAHNSYVHAYAELGMIGGTAFLGAWYLLIMALWRSRPCAARSAQSELDRWHACVTAVIVGYGVGLISLTRFSALPTYFVLGIACVYCAIRGEDSPDKIQPLSATLVGKTILVSLSFLVVLHIVVRVLAV